MSRRVVVVGTGKMARNLGRFFAARGMGVWFASPSAERLAALEQWAHKRMRRFFDAAPGEHVPRFVLLPGDRGALANADVVLEAGPEERSIKTQRLATLEPLVHGGALLASTSSSLLPSEIHPRSVGLHFFYPVELTSIVELVLPDDTPSARAEQARLLCDELGVRAIVEREAHGFVANRLLLPLQAASARVLLAGGEADALDAATTSDLLPMGQLALMDAIGIDVLAASVSHYLARMDPQRAEPLAPLSTLLAALLADGRLGDKAGRGILDSGPLVSSSAGRQPPKTSEPASLAPTSARALFVNACLRALDDGELDRRELDSLLDALYGGAEPFARALALEGDSMLRLLEGLFAQTGRWYCSPAPSLRRLGS